VRDVDPTVIGALIGAGPALLVGLGVWGTSHRSNNNAARESAREMFRWATEQVTSGNADAVAAGWVVLEEMAQDASLTAEDKRMMLGTVRKLRAIRAERSDP